MNLNYSYSIKGAEVAYFKILMSIFVNSTLYIAIIFSYIFIPVLFGNNILSRKVSGLFDKNRDIQWMKGLQLVSFIIYLLVFVYLSKEIYPHFRNAQLLPFNILHTGDRAEATFSFIIRMQVVAVIFFFLINKGSAFANRVREFYIKKIIPQRRWIISLMLILTVFFGYMRLAHVHYEFKRNLYSNETTPDPTRDEVRNALLSSSKYPHKWFAEMDGGEITNPDYK